MSEREDPYLSPGKQEDHGVAHTGSCLKTAVMWCMPSLVVPLIVPVFASIWPVGVALAIVFLTWMGAIQAAKPNPDSWQSSTPKWALVSLYVVVQLVWIPLFWLAVVWGFCAVSGTGGNWK